MNPRNSIGIAIWSFAAGIFICMYGFAVAETIPGLLTRGAAMLICIVGFGLLSTEYCK
jgi:hypothetical protein